MSKTRMEKDTHGEIAVPADAYWGAQTQRALRSFPIGAQRFPRPFIRALGIVKKAAARVNHRRDLLDAARCDAIVRAADEVIRGALDEHFPLVIWQAGSGTQTNMNANEVIANRAAELLDAPLGDGSAIHPNDHVNMSQSSNDVIPTALHVAAAEELAEALLPSVARLRATLAAKAEDFASLIKVGRTHLMDAAPVTLGQEIGGWVAHLDNAIGALERARSGLEPLALGGTAVGTGLNAPTGFGEESAAEIAALTGIPFVAAPNKFAAIAGHEAIAQASSATRTLAAGLMKIATDVRWMASGPRCGLGELTLPANEPGSSIMPGKVNPTQAEALTMVCLQVFGNDVTVGFAAGHGNFELNVAKPLLARNLLESIALLAAACASFEARCVAGMKPNEERMRELVERSLMLVTALSPRIGYERAAEIAMRAENDGSSLREAAIQSGLLSAEELDELIDPASMV